MEKEEEIFDGRGIKKHYYTPNCGQSKPEKPNSNLKLEVDGRTYELVETDGNREFVYFPHNRYEQIEVFEPGKYTRKQKRMYKVINSGMQLGIAQKEMLVFLTLSTKYDKDDNIQKEVYQKKLNYAFTKLKQKIERKLRRLMYLRECHALGLEPFSKGWRAREVIAQPEIWDCCKFKFKYFKVRTSEGGGVLHIVFRKSHNVPMLPQKWLSKTWAKIWHNSWNIDIRKIEYNDSKHCTRYIIGNYIQNQPVLRMSYGHHWVYPGFRKSFLNMIEVYSGVNVYAQDGKCIRSKIGWMHGYKRAVEVHKKDMENGILPTIAGTYQRKIYGKVGLDGEWHSMRYRGKPIKAKEDIKKTEYRAWKATLHFGWSDLRIDSPKYVSGFLRRLDSMSQPFVRYYCNTVVVAK